MYEDNLREYSTILVFKTIMSMQICAKALQFIYKECCCLNCICYFKMKIIKNVLKK